MSADWRRWCRAQGLRVEGEAIRVAFEDGRAQEVRVEERPAEEGVLRAWSVVARQAKVEGLDDPCGMAWSRNRVTDLVGFKIDARGRLIGEMWIPMAGLEADEWDFAIRSLALACDRFEYLLTGRDTE